MLNELENKIRKAIPELQNIEIGQRFYSEYYGIITATKITPHSKITYSIYGFDEKEGLPRDCYYPRDLTLIGKPIQLNHVLEYVQYKDVIFSLLMLWDIKSNLLSDQSVELIKFVNELKND